MMRRYVIWGLAAAAVYLLLLRTNGGLAGILPLAPIDSTTGQPLDLEDTGPLSYVDPAGVRTYFGPV